MSLACMFQVRLCNFKATGIQSAPNASPPFCVRGNFDGRAFNSEYFHSATMSPIWALDSAFEYQAPTIDSLRTKFLVLECYGADRFLGMARVDLFTLATGPTAVELSLKEGAKMNGLIAFEAQFQQQTSIQAQISRITLRNVGNRGYEGTPNPYLSFALGTGSHLESAIAADAESPEWERLPALHFRGTFQSFCDQRIQFELKHSRNGFTAGINDPLMATFEIALSSVPIEFGRDAAIPFREMVHSLPNYPFPFSCECVGLLEVRNLPQVVQLRGGVLTDDGVVGGVQTASSGGNASTVLNSSRAQTVALPEPSLSHPEPKQSKILSPARSRHGASAATGVTSVAELPSLSAVEAPSMPSTSHGMDFELLNQVSDKQQQLLSTVQERLRQIARRRTEVSHEIANAKVREEEHMEATERRRQGIQADLRAAVAEKERLENLLKTIAIRREEEERNATQLAAERERTRRAIEAEQQEVHLLQERVNQLRAEMTRHLEEEEIRYTQRVREAEEAKRRALRDAEDLAALESKLASAESRMQRGISAMRSYSPRRY